MRILKLESKVIKLEDYRKIDLKSDLPKFTLDTEKLQKDIKRVQYANGNKCDADTVKKGDIVKLSCSSSEPKFNKNGIFVAVGRNIWDKDFEEKLIGRKKNVREELEVNGTEITVNIESIVRTTVPPLTDEAVKSWNIAGVNTVDDLRRNFFNRQVDVFRDEDEDADIAVSLFFGKVVDGGKFDLADSEIETVKKTVEAQMNEVKELRKSYIESGEVDPDEPWDIESLFKNVETQTVKAAVIGYGMMEEKGCLLTEENYADEIKTRAMLMNISETEAKVRYTETDYAIEKYSQFFFDHLDDYVGEVMKTVYWEQNKNKRDVYDVAVIGAGPAGLSAALTLKLHNKSIIWFGSDTLSDKVEKSEKIANYAGFEPISGEELNNKFRAQMKSAKLELTDKTVTQITKNKNGFMILADNEIFKAKTVLMSVGAVPPKGFENEQELLGHGVSYCATCDGFLYKGKTIFVYCASKKYEHEISYLAELASKVYVYTPYDNCSVNLPNAEHLATPLKAVIGDNSVTGISLLDGTEISVDGAFFLRSAVAPSTILKGLDTDGAHIVINRNTETSVKGCFAAGDCTGRPYQIAKAVGEGNVAAHSIVKYLSESRE